MRSAGRGTQGQEALPIDVPAPAAARRVAPGPAGPERAGRFRLPDDRLASYGWPAGTELVVERGRRPQRGDLALVREGPRLLVGVFDRQLGRAVLRTDRGAVWLGPSARFAGVAVQADAPLCPMPGGA